jgi:hypothetical protein
MGFDFSILPGGGGATGPILTGLDLAIEATECIGLLDIFACFKAVIDVFSLLWDLFFGNLFAGRPKLGKDSASDDTALFFISSPNPVAAMWGMGIRALEAHGVPTSVSAGPGLAQTIKLADAVLADLRTQFDHPAAPKLLYHNEFGTFPVTGLNMFSWYHQLGFRTNHPDSNSEALRIRAQIDLFYTELVTLKWIDPQTGFPFTHPPPPPPPPPKPQPPSQIPKPPPAIPHNADEEEVCCWYEEQYAYHLALAAENISTLLHQQGASDQCCAQIVAALNAVNRSVAEVTAAIGHGSAAVAAKIDLSHVAAGLQELVVVLTENLRRPPAAEPALIAALDRIAAAEEKEKPIDLKAVIDALQKANEIQDTPKSIVDQMLHEGILSPELAQLAQGSGPGHVAPGRETSGIRSTALFLYRLFGGAGPAGFPTAHEFKEATTTAAKDIFEGTFAASKSVFGGMVDGILLAHKNEISKLRNVGPCEEAGGASALLTEAIGAGIAAHFASVAAEAVFFTKNLGLEKIADIIVALAGVEPIIEALIGTEIKQLIQIPHEYCINAQGRTILPSRGQGFGLHARGLITEAQARQLAAYNGLNHGYETPELNAAYGGINARMMLRLIETGLFSDHDIADELTFSGMRPASQHRLLMAAPYLATEPERKQLRAELEKAFVDGFISDADLTQQLDDAEHNTSRTFLILDRVRLQKRLSLARDLEAEYSTLYLGNQINLTTYHANLAGLGLQDDRVRALSAKYEARSAVTLARQEAAAARALAKETAAEERKAAMRNYIQGNINAAGLAAALVLTGLTTTQTAAWVDMAALEAAGKPRHSFGLRLAPDQANLLSTRVRALNDQRKRQLITDLEFRNSLRALHIPDNYINGLRAAADATITPAKSALLLPVETGA